MLNVGVLKNIVDIELKNMFTVNLIGGCICIQTNSEKTFNFSYKSLYILK